MRKILFVGALSLLVAACRPALDAVTVQPQLYEVTDDLALAQVPGTDPEVAAAAALIAPYKARLDETMNRQLATLAAPLTKQRPESTLGNWMADLLQEAATDLYPEYDVAFSAANYGGLRVSEIGAGPLLVSEIYELMPFDNQWVLVELTGAETKALVSHIAGQGGWPVSRELSVRQGADGQLDVRLSGEAIDPAATYYVALPDYVANGGGNTTMVVGKPQITAGKFMRDLLIEYAAKATEPIRVTTDGSRMSLNR